MTDDKIIDAIAGALYGAETIGYNKDYHRCWDTFSKENPELAEDYRADARLLWEAAKAALAAEGFVIHRFHDPVRVPVTIASYRLKCRRCGIQMGGIEDAASCVPDEAAR